ncbi:MAG: Gfo/Idh/MocA family protein, partial [bacterium]
MEPIKLGIIGCGIAANELHWPALKNLQDKFQITMVCNNTGKKARAFAQRVGDVPFVLDYQEILRNPEVEAVDIALPIYLNYQVVKDALTAGKHVFVEKPLAANLDEAGKLLRFSEGFSRVKMVGENWLYHPVFLRLKQMMDEGQIGEPYGIFWDVLQRVTLDSKYARTQWRIDHKHRGGFITDGGIHNIAALRLMFEEIIAGSAFAKSVNPEIGEVDTLSFQFETKRHAHGILNIFRSPQGVAKNDLLILGTTGSIVVEANKKVMVKQADGSERIEMFENDTSYRAEFEDFYSAIRNHTSVRSSFAQAYRDLQVLLLALERATKFHEN